MLAVSGGVVEYKENHSAENIFYSVEGKNGLINKWGLSNFHRTYNTDSYSSMVSAFRGTDGINWIPCWSYVIHNAITAGLKSIKNKGCL